MARSFRLMSQVIGKDGKSQQQRATLRVCARCEWIYKGAEKLCPKCGFASYGAYWVYGKKCYRLFINQSPWKYKKMFAYEQKLDEEIKRGQR